MSARRPYFFSAAFLGLLLSAAGQAQTTGSGFHSESPEDFRIEVTGSAWILNAGGRLSSDGTPVDLVSDLNVGQQQPTFFGQFVLKPGRKHRIILEGTPVQESGNNTVQRIITYRGQSFNVSSNIRSSADLTYFFAGYQYDLLTGPKGHLGLSVGGAYLSGYGSILASQSTTAAPGTETVGLPLAGLDFRVFPVPGHRILEIDGGMRGMGFGAYGYFVEADANGGICFGPVTFLGGYRAINFDLHNTGVNANGIQARLRGPSISAVFRW